ncbi:TauD/TfdA family dioxygenase [Streptomyces sp. NBC_00249]|uniref:TauD/TfdA family dioxygenase n=1 Tax=Streptomyces sp. NBC_00249 TaxID=2975690 RepID=UPI002257FC52|nr:TauD/TfdA family dioxygenase [Streptomyces sp. NBC_00249]MCX5199201.1 TauD/TfdA family dioxygenase [Streptomyces sp. NBC_00249]
MADLVHGWDKRSVSDPALYVLRYDADHDALARRVRTQLTTGPGFAVVTGVPVHALPTEQVRDTALAMMRPLGRPLPQGTGSDEALAWLVRDEGVSAHTDERRFSESAYTSKSRGYLHLHNDAAVSPFGHEPDYVSLLVHRTARTGGATVLVDALTVHRVLAHDHPHHLALLHTPFAFDRRHVAPPGRPPVVWGPPFAHRDGHLRARCNTVRMRGAYDLLDEPLPADRGAAIDALEAVLHRPELALTLELAEGDCLIVDDHRILHGRTAYEDPEDDPARRRCLVRVMAQAA